MNEARPIDRYTPEELAQLETSAALLELVCRKAADRFGPEAWGEFIKEIKLDQ